MKLVIERAALLKSLGHVQSVVERRNTIPILSNVRIDAKKGELALNATDMDIEIAESTAADIGKGGATTAPAHTLYEIVRKLPEGSQVEIATSSDGNQVTLSSGRSRFALACLPVEDFPALSAQAGTGSDYSHTFTVAAANLKALIDRTRFAISTEETRYYLNGIFLHAAKSDGVAVLRAVATDGHRLARVESPLPDGGAGMPGVIVPRKTVAELRKLIEEADGDIEIALSDAKIRFSFDNVVLTSKLIDGTFPDYERVIPAGNDKVLEVPRKDLFDAVDRVSAISSEKSRSIKMTCEKGLITLSASSPEAGSATEEVEASYAAGTLEIGFNSRYLLDILQQIEGDAARFSMSDAASPTIIRDVADGSAVYVLMPMRV
ncbi:MAG: DNA polymerase III subunit beta [Rhodospirillaceae bacterium]|nr:DNA polymerase III subunit beta [Rhodospirillaceae bacterium]